MNIASFALPLFAAVGLLSLAPAGLVTDGAAAGAVSQGPHGGGCHHGYSLRSLDGRHGFTYQGSSAVLGSIASSGRIDFDGDGHLFAQYTTSVNGVAFTGNFTGTYTVNTNGTGSIVLNLPQPGMQAHGDFVLVDRGDETFFTSTDTGYSVVGRTRKM